MAWLRQLIAGDESLDQALAQLAQDDDLREQLSETLQSHPSHTALSSLSVIVVFWMCAHFVPTIGTLLLACLITFLGLLRIAFAVLPNGYTPPTKGTWLDRVITGCALSFSLGLGVMAAIVLIVPAPVETKVTTVAVATVFGLGTPIHNIGRPIVATAGLGLTLFPILVACFIVGSPALVILALIFLSLTIVSIGHAKSTLRNLAERIAIAQSSRMYAEAMHSQSLSDPVTGLANRDGFNHQLASLIEERGVKQKILLLWMDLHRFKQVNETLGHVVGDAVLKKTANRLLECSPEHAVLSRFASDEFLLAAYVDDRKQAEKIAKCVGKATDETMRIGGHRIGGGASIGAAILPDDAADADRLMQAADLGLYHAKAVRSDNIRFFNDNMTRELVRKKEIEAELRAAILRDELSVYFQPIVDLDTGRIRAFEALVRWFHPDKGELRPDEFIPIAEESGLIITLGNWITAEAAKTAVLWPDEIMLAINLSPAQIKAPGAALGILNALRSAKLDPSRLELEVTEGLFLDDDEQTNAFMTELAKEGVYFALDDFGTGYSSLHYIHMHPFRTIKVDRSFVSGANAGDRSHAIIRAVAEMGKRLDMQIVAEGLETAEQVSQIHQAGCTLGQGWYFSRAIPGHSATMLLAQEHEETAFADNNPPAWRKVG